MYWRCPEPTVQYLIKNVGQLSIRAFLNSTETLAEEIVCLMDGNNLNYYSCKIHLQDLNL